MKKLVVLSASFLFSVITANMVFAQANTELSNLVTTKINQNLLPQKDHVKNLGSAGKSWKDIYLDGYLYMDGKIGFACDSEGNVTAGTGAFSDLDGQPAYFFLTRYTSAYGDSAGKDNFFGSENTFVGYSSGKKTAGAFANSFFGAYSGFNDDAGGASDGTPDGNVNTFIGYKSGYTNEEGYSNTFVGAYSGFSNLVTGNSFFGYESGKNNTTGNRNTFLGNDCGYANTNGTKNTFTGDSSGRSNSTGVENTFNGYQSGVANTGSYNTFMGSSSGTLNTSGNYNVAIGTLALNDNISGGYNAAVGRRALENTSASIGNTALGYSAGDANDNGSYNIFIGYNADASAAGLTNSVAIGQAASVNASNKMQLGSSTTTLSTSGGYTIVSDARFKEDVAAQDVHGLDFINKLHPVTYRFNYKSYDDFLHPVSDNQNTDAQPTDDNYQRTLVEKSKERQTGFLAQDVDKVVRDNGFTFNGVYTPQNDHDNYALDYSRFVVPLVKAVQELATTNDTLKSEVGTLKAENTDLKDRVAKLETLSSSQMNNGAAKIAVTGESISPLLGQNIPNPFDNSTVIPFRIPKNCNSASIVISESATGKIVTAIPVSCSETNVMVDAGTLASGTYTYSLYLDGKVIDTKQMIITK